MELRPGYKQTELGVIPEEWEICEIGDLKPFVTSGSRGWAGFYSERGSLFVRITNLSRESIYLDLQDLKFVNLPPGASEGTRTQLNEHDVLISITADIGVIGYVDSSVPTPAYINQHIALVRFDPSQVSGRFVSYFLASEQAQKLFRASTDIGAKAGMSLVTVQKIKVVLPSTLEQRAIAATLSDVDELIGALDQLIAKKRDLKQAAMQKLLTGKRRLPGFANAITGYKQTEVGLIPEDWEIHQLGDIGTFKNGINKDSGAFGHGSPFVNLMDVFGVSAIASAERLGLVASNGNEQKTYNLKRGDVVLIRSSVKPSGVGLTAVVENDLPETVYSGFLIRFRDGGFIDTDFKRHCFYQEGFRRRVIGASSVSANTNINQDHLTRLFLALPSTKAEQQAIAEILSDMDAEIVALEARRDKTRALKHGMMQELLTGRIRLV